MKDPQSPPLAVPIETFKKLSPYLAGIVMCLIFGLSFLFSKQGLADLAPMILLSYRFGIAALVLTVLLLLGLIKVDFKGKPMKGVILLSVFYPVLAFVFEVNGLRFTATSQAGIMVSLMPIFVSLLGVVILKEKPAAVQWCFILSSVAGVLITVIFSKSAGEEGSFWGILLLLISVAGGSIQNVLSRKYSKYFTSVEITFVMIWLGAIAFNAAAVIQGLIGGNLKELYAAPFHSVNAMLAVVYLGALASVVAFFCMNYMLAKLKAANASVFVNLATVISILAGVLWLHEALHWYQAVGGVFIIAGVWGTNYYENRGNKAQVLKTPAPPETSKF